MNPADMRESRNNVMFITRYRAEGWNREWSHAHPSFRDGKEVQAVPYRKAGESGCGELLFFRLPSIPVRRRI
jgi:hypothetical protein